MFDSHKIEIGMEREKIFCVKDATSGLKKRAIAKTKHLKKVHISYGPLRTEYKDKKLLI
jgi:hypothetical protein